MIYSTHLYWFCSVYAKGIIAALSVRLPQLNKFTLCANCQSSLMIVALTESVILEYVFSNMLIIFEMASYLSNTVLCVPHIS